MRPSSSANNSRGKNKLKRSRKLKKEKRRRDRCEEKKRLAREKENERFGNFSRFLIWFLLFCANGLVISAPVKKSQYSLENASNDLGITARIINGMALNEGLKDGSVNWGMIMNEFLGLKDDVSLSVLSGENWGSFEKFMTDLHASLVQQCGDQLKCFDEKAIEAGIKKLQEFKSFSVKQIETALDSFEPLVILKKLYDAKVDIEKEITFVVKAIEKLSSLATEKEKLDHIKASINLERFVLQEDDFNAVFATLAGKTFDENYAVKFDEIIKFETEINTVTNSATTLQAMKKQLKNLGKLVVELNKHLSDGKEAEVSKVLKLLLKVANSDQRSQDEKKWTPGFPDGISDLNKLPTDIESSLLKQIIAGNKDPKVLRPLVSNVLNKPDELKDLETANGIRKILMGVEGNVRKVEESLESIKAGMEKTEVFESLRQCVEKSDFKAPLEFKKWTSEKERYNEHKSKLKGFFDKLKVQSSPFAGLTQYQNLKSLLENKQTPDDKLLEFDFTALKTELEKFIVFDVTGDFEPWVTNTEIAKTVQKLRNSLKGFDLRPVIDCLNKDDVMNEASKELPAQAQMLTAISTLAPGNEDVKAVTDTIKKVQKPIFSFLKLTKTQKKVARHRRRFTPKRDQLFSLTKGVGDGMRIFHDIFMAKQTQEAIKKISEAIPTIDAEIEKLSDSEKAEIKKLWTPEYKKMIQGLAGYINKVEASIAKNFKSRPLRITDFRTLFNSVEFEQLPDLNGPRTQEVFSSLQKPDNIQTTLESIGSLNLEFSSFKAKAATAAGALQPLEKLFDDLFKIDRTVLATPETDAAAGEKSEEKGTPLWLIAIYAVLGVALLGILGFAAYKGALTFLDRKDKKTPKEKVVKPNGPPTTDGTKNTATTATTATTSGGTSKAEEVGKKVPQATDQQKLAMVKQMTEGSSTRRPKPVEPAVRTAEEEKKLKEKKENIKKQMVDKKLMQMLDGKDGKPGVVVRKAKMKKYQTKDPFFTEVKDLKDQFKDIYKLNEKAAKEMAEKFLNMNLEDRIKWFRENHDGLSPSDLYRIARIVFPEKYVKKPADVRKFLLALNTQLMIDQEIIDKEHAKKTLEFQDFPMPKCLTVEELKDRAAQVPEDTTWEEGTIMQPAEITHEFLVSRKDLPTGILEDLYKKRLNASRRGFLGMSGRMIRKTASKLWTARDNTVSEKTTKTCEESREEAGNEDHDQQRADSEQQRAEWLAANQEKDPDYFDYDEIERIMEKLLAARLAASKKEGCFARSWRTICRAASKLFGARDDDAVRLAEQLKKNHDAESFDYDSVQSIMEEREAAGAEAKAKEPKKAEKPPKDYGFCHDKTNEKYFYLNFIAATCHEFRKAKTAQELGRTHPITIDMLTYAIEEAQRKFESETAHIDIKSKVLIPIGDIHGSYLDFIRHLLLIISDPNAVGLFLGDYVDRGERNVEIVYLLCLAKIIFPHKIKFLRGNHETPMINSVFGFMEECATIYGSADGRKFFEASNKMFQTLPLCATYHGKSFYAHGGVSELFTSPDVLAEIKKQPKTVREWNLWYDILWSDPIYMISEDDPNKVIFTRSPRSPCANVFNQNALEKVMNAMGWLLVVRGHEVKKHGFEYFYNRKLITVFGACNNAENNKAAQLCLNVHGVVTVKRFTCTDDLEDDYDFDDDELTEAN